LSGGPATRALADLCTPATRCIFGRPVPLFGGHAAPCPLAGRARHARRGAAVGALCALMDRCGIAIRHNSDTCLRMSGPLPQPAGAQDVSAISPLAHFGHAFSDYGCHPRPPALKMFPGYRLWAHFGHAARRHASGRPEVVRPDLRPEGGIARMAPSARPWCPGFPAAPAKEIHRDLTTDGHRRRRRSSRARRYGGIVTGR